MCKFNQNKMTDYQDAPNYPNVPHYSDAQTTSTQYKYSSPKADEIAYGSTLPSVCPKLIREPNCYIVVKKPTDKEKTVQLKRN